MTHDLHAQLRGLAVRGVVTATADGGETQTADVTTHDGVERRGAEILQPFGFASRPPAGGAVTVVIGIGGDQGDPVALPLAAPGVRLGHLAEGETALYVASGTRIHLQADGAIRVVATAKVTVKAPLVEIEAPRVRIKGDVQVEGNLKVSGQVEDAQGPMQDMRDRYNGHRHGSGPTPDRMMD